MALNTSLKSKLDVINSSSSVGSSCEGNLSVRKHLRDSGTWQRESRVFATPSVEARLVRKSGRNEWTGTDDKRKISMDLHRESGSTL